MAPDEMTDDAVEYILNNFDPRHGTKWEQSFIESVTDQWHRRHSLSDRQKEVLGQIWERQP